MSDWRRVGHRSGGQLVTTFIDHYFNQYFPFHSSWSLPFLIKWLLESKNLFSESCFERPKPRVRPFSRPVRPGGLDFAGSAVL